MSDLQTIKQCRCCGSDKLYQYIDLGNQPLANSYHKGEILPTFPLQVMLCEECFHNQLSIVVEPSLMFKHYLYVSGTTATFRNHCKELAKDSRKRINKEQPRVLDIACNDGTLLSYFREEGCDVYGVDPAENLRDLTEQKDIPVVVDYWGCGTASQKLEGRFDIITGTNVFAHVNDISGFLDECIEVLDYQGRIILEFPYCQQMIGHCEFDTIYHEHLSYFLVNSFNNLVTSKGLAIDDIVQTSIHGGSIRFILRKWTMELGGYEGHHQLIEKECELGLLQKETYVNFSEQVKKNKQDMQLLVKQLQEDGKKVIGYGASAKGNTMLNYFGIDLDYIVDDNPMKWGYMTPGRNIVIKSPEVLADEGELYIVILAWNFFDEIIKKIERITNKKDHYICYVPEVTIK